MTTRQVSGRRGPRGSYAKSATTRQAILDAALEVFAGAGFHNGSLRNVAEKVGISEAGLLHHYPSKAALLAAVLERRDQHDRVDFDYTEVHGRRIIGGFLELAERNETVPEIVELFCRLAAEASNPEHPAHEYFRERYELIRAVARTAFRDLAGRGELRPGVDPDRAARSVVAVMDGLQVQWLLDRESVDMAGDLRQFFASIVIGDL